MVYDSAREPGVIYDLLVAERGSSFRLEESRALAALGRLYDRAIREGIAHQEEVAERICRRLGICREIYRRGAGQVQFLDRPAMARFFHDDAPESLRHILERVARVWHQPGTWDERGLPSAAFEETLERLTQGMPNGSSAPRSRMRRRPLLRRSPGGPRRHPASTSS